MTSSFFNFENDLFPKHFVFENDRFVFFLKQNETIVFQKREYDPSLRTQQVDIAGISVTGINCAKN